MAAIGYTLSSEEFGPRELVDFARRAEEAGFDFVSISDHFHPWIDQQGNSPFVWAVIGGVAEATLKWWPNAVAGGQPELGTSLALAVRVGATGFEPATARPQPSALLVNRGAAQRRAR